MRYLYNLSKDVELSGCRAPGDGWYLQACRTATCQTCLKYTCGGAFPKTHELSLSPQHQATTANTLDLCPPALRQFVGP